MAVLSGKSGTLLLGGTAVTPCSNWSASISGNLKAYGANTTQKWKRRVSGTNDATGTFLIRVDDSKCSPVLQGAIYQAQFHVDDTLANYYEVMVMIESIDVEDDIDDGDIVNYVIAWGADSPLTAHGILDDATCGWDDSSSSGE